MMSPFFVAQQSPVVPVPYDIVWSLAGLLWLLIPVGVAVAERRRGASWVETFLWFVVALLLPVVGLVLWAISRIMGGRKSSQRAPS